MQTSKQYIVTRFGIPLKILFIYSSSNKNWALHHIANDLCQVMQNSTVVDVPIQIRKIRILNFKRRFVLPKTDIKVFMHHKMLGEIQSTKLNSRSINASIFTHDIYDQYFLSKTLPYLQSLDLIFTLCEKDKQKLIENGIQERNLVTILGAADPEFFKLEHNPNYRERGRIGICSNYLNRKNPNRILEMIRANQEIEFILHGKNWRESHVWEKLVNLRNFEYIEFEYANQPKFLNSVDALVSLSTLEGGPTPVLESLMCGTPTIVTPVGYGSEITQHKVTGYLLADESGSDLDLAIEWVLSNRQRISRQSIRDSVIHLNWERYGKIVGEALVQKAQKLE